MAQKAVAAAMAQGFSSKEQMLKSRADKKTESKAWRAESLQSVQRNGTLAAPLHLQRLQGALNLAPVIAYVEDLFSRPVKPSCGERNGLMKTPLSSVEKELLDQEKRVINGRPYRFSEVQENGRQWLKELLLSDSSMSSDDDSLCNDDLQILVNVHTKHKQPVDRNQLKEFQYYSAGLLSTVGKMTDTNVDSDFADAKDNHSRMPLVNPQLAHFNQNLQKKVKVMRKKKRKPSISSSPEDDVGDDDYYPYIQPVLGDRIATGPVALSESDARRKKVWAFIIKKEIPKTQRQKNTIRNNTLSAAKKIALLCQKEVRKKAIKSQKCSKDTVSRARRLAKEMLVYWKKYEKVEREHRKRAEKEALEQRKLEDEMREARRQQRKLNFLITQTELYAHFMAKKLTGDKENSMDKILKKLDEAPMQMQGPRGCTVTLAKDDYDVTAVKSQVMANVHEAVQTNETRTQTYDAIATGNRNGNSNMQLKFDENYSLANPMMDVNNAPQPSCFEGQLKSYQLKGMNWLASLYHQGINGILADEMGLGKTVQSIAVLAHLAEVQNIWGPFLVVAPASTLHNWQQEVSRFVPMFRVLPYWGTLNERKILRKYMTQDRLTAYTKDAPAHIVITSYQIVISDVKFFQRLQWQYLILDEAQAIKSSSSIRWKMLLGFKCRNRLLLTGTPIQNTMAELWALLHFIMPTLFDSHAEFNEWFSKDIESHAEKKSGLDENQLSRLHLILKPFMLRRIKKDVENEMADKIEIQLTCQMTERQRRLYQGVRNRISIEELLRSTSTTSSAQASSNTLMNLVMQLRKVCNHPELFERRDVQSPFVLRLPEYELPRLLFHEELIGGIPRELKRLFCNLLSIWSTEYIHHSLFPSDEQERSSCFSFLRFVDVSPSEISAAMLSGLLTILVSVVAMNAAACRLYHARLWGSGETENHDGIRWKLLLALTSPLSVAAINMSSILQDLVFTSHTSSVTSHETHTIYRSYFSAMSHSVDVSQRVHTLKSPTLQSPICGTLFTFGQRSPTKISSPTKSVAPQLPAVTSNSTECLQDLLCDDMLPPEMTTPIAVRKLQPTSLPSFLLCCVPRAASGMRFPLIVDRNAEYLRQELMRGGTPAERNFLLTGISFENRRSLTSHLLVTKVPLYPSPAGGLNACQPERGWSHIQIPDKELLVIDAAKLNVLDRLLSKLKRERHRVLIYCQMTRMIDLLEEYMGYRKHKYIRLDGSSKIADRRDMVADFQTRSEIFVFLLSTRAGGLGINLTAADTVIFYDSDWNPTVDQQAMDRAHRLGQTKQVTVYRLVTKGTVEERILQRAKEKSEIQKMVISGGQFRPDALKPKEVVSLLLDDTEMESKFLQKQAEQEQMRKKRRKRLVGNQQPTDSLAAKKPKSRTATLKAESGIDSQQPSPAAHSYSPSVMSSVASNDDDDDDCVELEIDLSMTGEGLDDFAGTTSVLGDNESSFSELPLSPSALFNEPTVGKARGPAGSGKGRGARKNRKLPGTDSGTPAKKARITKRPRAGLSAQGRSMAAAAGAAAATATLQATYSDRNTSTHASIVTGQRTADSFSTQSEMGTFHRDNYHANGSPAAQSRAIEQRTSLCVPASQHGQTSYLPPTCQVQGQYRTDHIPSLYSSYRSQHQ